MNSAMVLPEYIIDYDYILINEIHEKFKWFENSISIYLKKFTVLLLNLILNTNQSQIFL
jgi:hypothetical protein